MQRRRKGNWSLVVQEEGTPKDVVRWLAQSNSDTLPSSVGITETGNSLPRESVGADGCWSSSLEKSFSWLWRTMVSVQLQEAPQPVVEDGRARVGLLPAARRSVRSPSSPAAASELLWRSLVWLSTTVLQRCKENRRRGRRALPRFHSSLRLQVQF